LRGEEDARILEGKEREDVEMKDVSKTEE